MIKKCTKCTEVKTIDNFTKRFQNYLVKDGSTRTCFYYRSTCRECVKHYNKNKWTINSTVETREKRNARIKEWRNTRILQSFGITANEYDSLKEEQNSICFLCKTPRNGRLALDHDHETGAIRRFLCSFCNRALGLFQDSPELLREAAAYIESFKGLK